MVIAVGDQYFTEFNIPLKLRRDSSGVCIMVGIKRTGLGEIYSDDTASGRDISILLRACT